MPQQRDKEEIDRVTMEESQQIVRQAYSHAYNPRSILSGQQRIYPIYLFVMSRPYSVNRHGEGLGI